MRQPTSTIVIEATNSPTLIRMTWSHEVNGHDVKPAFEAITQYLDAANQPIYILVDILSDPIFPLRETISSALWTAYKHPMLAEWLIVGANPLAHAIERTLSKVTGRHNVVWFHHEVEAIAHWKIQLDQKTIVTNIGYSNH